MTFPLLLCIGSILLGTVSLYPQVAIVREIQLPDSPTLSDQGLRANNEQRLLTHLHMTRMGKRFLPDHPPWTVSRGIKITGEAPEERSDKSLNLCHLTFDFLTFDS